MSNNPADAKRFIAVIFEPDDLIEIRLILPKKTATGQAPEQKWFLARELDNFLPWAESQNVHGWGVYVGAHPRKQRGGGKSKDVAVCRCFFADFDDCPLDLARQRCDEADLPAPTIIVKTGRPSGGYQFWWLLDEPMTDRLRWERVQAAIVRDVQSDASVKDAARVLRVPGFANTKYEGAPVAAIVELEPGRTYPVCEFPEPERASECATATPASIEREGKPGKVIRGDRRKVLETLGRLKSGRADNYAEWLTIGMILHSVDPSASMLEVWDAWSQKSSKYEPGACAKKWTTFKGSGVEADSIAKENGIERRCVTVGTLIAWASEDDPDCRAIPYRATSAGLIWEKSTKDGLVPMPLSNFTARIVGQVAEDDGIEVKRALEIEGELNGRRRHFTVAASHFSSLSWVVENLGGGAVVYAGFGCKDHVRCAVQLLSGTILDRTVFTHSGWRKVGDRWVYLHAGGALGSNGSVAGIETSLPAAIKEMKLPNPSEGNELRQSVKAALRLLDLGPDRVAVPLFAATWRSVLGGCDFALHLSGRTSMFKTALAALVQQHFGVGFDARNLPGSWSSTGNALEALAFSAKDMVLVVDDFAPAGTTYDVAQLHKEADRLIRAQGNRSGRGRLRADGTIRAAKPPRGLILSTGEDVPRGESLRARMPVVEIEEGDITSDVLTRAQSDAAAGHYANAMAGYVRWLAGRYEHIHEHLHKEIAELRDEAARSGQHRRTPDIIASMAVGIRWFLRFAREVGAVDEAVEGRLLARCWTALGAFARKQVSLVRASDPVLRFLELLGSAIASGRAHIASAGGDEPEDPAAWGWRETTIVGGQSPRTEWRPAGDRVGWIDAGDLYLDPAGSYRTAQAMAGPAGEAITVGERTLWKRLHERHLLRSIDEARQTLKVRQKLEGQRRNVLHLSAEALHSPENAANQATDDSNATSDSGDGDPRSGLRSGLLSGSGPSEGEPDQEEEPITPLTTPRSRIDPTLGRVGRVGRVSQGRGHDDCGSGDDAAFDFGHNRREQTSNAAVFKNPTVPGAGRAQ